MTHEREHLYARDCHGLTLQVGCGRLLHTTLNPRVLSIGNMLWFAKQSFQNTPQPQPRPGKGSL